MLQKVPSTKGYRTTVRRAMTVVAGKMSSLAHNINVHNRTSQPRIPSIAGMRRACSVVIIHGIVLLLSGVFILTWAVLFVSEDRTRFSMKVGACQGLVDTRETGIVRSTTTTTDTHIKWTNVWRSTFLSACGMD